jgi:hypothetical protein
MTFSVLGVLFVSCFFGHLAIAIPIQDQQQSKKTEFEEQSGAAIARDKRSSNNRSVVPRSVQFTSSFRSSDCAQQKEVPRNCYHAKLLGHRISGVYEIDPRDDHGSFKVYCDMQTDGGGWTVFQRRQDGSVDFYRTWRDYQQGFGELYGEFWLGLEKLHRLTTSGVTLRVDLTATDNSDAFAKYEKFVVGGVSSKYVMYFGSYSGTAGDSLTYHKGMKFSTKDMDNDKDSRNCATSYSGAWWYNNCLYSNLNGYYSYGSSSYGHVVWHAFKSTYSLQTAKMMVKRV